jgi:hypothetical protein
VSSVWLGAEPERRALQLGRREGAIVSANTGDEPAATDTHDRVINLIFESGLTLARIVGLQRVDDEVATLLHSAIDRLDTAVRELRGAALAGVLEHHDARPDMLDQTVGAHWRRRLCRVTVDEVFAYAVGGLDFYRASDHQLWAHESDGLLLSARSGAPLARRDGNLYFDIESNLPLYYEDQRDEPPPTQTA